ncbi:hypothetical protein SO694_00029362 [Aureococcus anophagefferens]|uniref:EF-hand domain-containing protein n=1 Tax=Aureococcus anophagefferens TaxID=44056 RepID=A0ABR1FWD0_AURAN
MRLPKFAPSSMHLAGRAPTAIISSLARPASAPTTKWATLARAVERHDHLALPEHFNRPTAARHVDSTIEIAETLLLQPNELFALAAVFRDVDADANGVVDVEEFLARVGVHKNFARRVFSIFDADGDGKVDFREFVVALWQFCTADDVGECAFRCFATQREGVYELGAAERAYLVDAVHHPSNEAARVSFGLVDTSLGDEVRGGRRREATRKSLAKLGDGNAVGLQAWNASRPTARARGLRHPDAGARRRFLDPPRRRKLPRTVLDRPGPGPPPPPRT